MFEGIDAVDWSELGSFHGNSVEVPEMFRALAVAEQESEAAFVAAYGVLYDELNHQSDLSEASAAAVPFLLELAERQDGNHRPQYLRWLHTVASASRGSSLRRHPPDLPGFELEDEDLGLGPDPWAQFEGRTVGSNWSAVLAEHGRIEALLEHDADAEVRQRAVLLLATMDPIGPTIIGVLERCWSHEPAPTVRSTIAIALAELALALGRESDECAGVSAWLSETYRSESDTDVRLWLATAGLAIDAESVPTAVRHRSARALRLGGGSSIPGAWDMGWMDLLEHWSLLTDPATQVPALLSSDDATTRRRGLRNAGELNERQRELPDEVLDAVLDLLGAADPDERFRVLRLAGGWGPRLAPAGDRLATLVAARPPHVPFEGPAWAGRDVTNAEYLWSLAVVALVRVGDPRAIEPVLDIIRTGPPDLFAEIVDDIGPAVPEALPLLAQYLAGELDHGSSAHMHMDTREALNNRAGAARALARFGASAQPYLELLTMPGFPVTYEGTLPAIAALGPIAEPLLPWVERQLGGLTAKPAALAWLRAGGAADRILPMLDDVVRVDRVAGTLVDLTSGLEWVGDFGLIGMSIAAALGPSAAPWVEDLRDRMVARQAPAVRVTAARATWLVTGNPRRPVQVCTALASCSPEGVHAVRTLGMIGPAAHTATERLLEIQGSDVRPLLPASRQGTGRRGVAWLDDELRAACETALGSIRA